MHYVLLTASELYPMIPLKTPIEELSWVHGTRLDEPIPSLRFEVESREPFTWCDYIIPGADIPLFSRLMRDLLEKGGVDNVDYYEAFIRHKPTGEEKKYWAANIVGKVKGMDREKSKFAPFDDHPVLVEDIEKLVLDEKELQGVRICRLAEYRNLIIIDGMVKNIIEQAGVTGVVFCEPEQWSLLGRGL